MRGKIGEREGFYGVEMSDALPIITKHCTDTASLVVVTQVYRGHSIVGMDLPKQAIVIRHLHSTVGGPRALPLFEYYGL